MEFILRRNFTNVLVTDKPSHVNLHRYGAS